jgi:hypothetical protein
VNARPERAASEHRQTPLLPMRTVNDMYNDYQLAPIDADAAAELRAAGGERPLRTRTPATHVDSVSEMPTSAKRSSSLLTIRSPSTVHTDRRARSSSTSKPARLPARRPVFPSNSPDANSQCVPSMVAP